MAALAAASGSGAAAAGGDALAGAVSPPAGAAIATAVAVGAAAGVCAGEVAPAVVEFPPLAAGGVSSPVTAAGEGWGGGDSCLAAAVAGAAPATAVFACFLPKR